MIALATLAMVVLNMQTWAKNTKSVSFECKQMRCIQAKHDDGMQKLQLPEFIVNVDKSLAEFEPRDKKFKWKMTLRIVHVRRAAISRKQS